MVTQHVVGPHPHPLVLDQEKWGNYLFSKESFAKISGDSLDLLDAHYEEVGSLNDVVPLDPDWDGMFYYESKGQLVSCVVRLAETGKVLGYAMYILTPTLHAKNTLHAISDVVYIVPEWRKGLMAFKFLNFVERHCKMAGAKVMHTFMPAKVSAAVMERVGHKIYEVTYMKVL